MATIADWPNMKAIREELHMSQDELALMLGVSVRTVQSCEQGWRQPSPAVEKVLLLVLVTHRHGRAIADFRCWDVMGCSQAQHDNCLTYRSGQGSLCWFLIGNQCAGRAISNWEEKKAMCRKCKFFRRLLPDYCDDE